MFFPILKFLLISAVITAILPFGLIVSQKPVAQDDLPVGDMSFDGVVEAGPRAEMALQEVPARDGATLTAWALPAQRQDAPLLVMVHGSGWHGEQFASLAARLEGQADMLAVNLRGHFNGPEPRGDLAYMGQLEDDLADLIAARRKPGQQVVLLGHSSGGGLVVRFAGGAHGAMIEKAVLLAPFLKYNAPTTREKSGGWAHVLKRRVIGLSMLNAVGIHALDHLTVIQFAMPDAVRNGPLGGQATLAYSWRLNQSYAPRADYLADVAALPDFLLVVGAQDESFVAEGYETLMAGASDKGRYHLLEGVNHLGVVDATATAHLIREFLR